MAQTNYMNATPGVVGKAEALEKHLATVSRCRRLFTTESGFFQTTHERHEEAQNQSNALSAQLRAAVAAPKADFRLPKTSGFVFSTQPVSITKGHEYEPPQSFDDDSESDQSSLSDQQHARSSSLASTEMGDQTRQGSKPSERVGLVKFAL